jgi:hypothetical protein
MHLEPVPRLLWPIPHHKRTLCNHKEKPTKQKASNERGTHAHPAFQPNEEKPLNGFQTFTFVKRIRNPEYDLEVIKINSVTHATNYRHGR